MQWIACTALARSTSICLSAGRALSVSRQSTVCVVVRTGLHHTGPLMSGAGLMVEWVSYDDLVANPRRPYF